MMGILIMCGWGLRAQKSRSQGPTFVWDENLRKKEEKPMELMVLSKCLFLKYALSCNKHFHTRQRQGNMRSCIAYNC